MITLKVNGKVYSTWISVKVTRGLKVQAGSFTFEAPGEYIPTILPGMSCQVMEGADPLLTGYIDDVDPDIAATSSRTVITGRSKTMDLVDCTPEFTTNQFNGAKLDAIARAVAGAFSIDVVIGSGVDVGAAFPDATFERSEKAYHFLERLARQRGVLLTDDGLGNLVLATLGTAKAPASLVMGPGGNVYRARGKLSGKERFSKYTIRSQAGKIATGAAADNAVKAVAYDGAVTRYRPWAGYAETAAVTGGAQIRADWEAAHRSGEAVKGILSVPEFRANGTLWTDNQLAFCNVPRLSLKDTFLIGEITYLDDEKGGRRTELTVQPPSAFLPDQAHPGKKHKTGSGAIWEGIQPVVGSVGTIG